MYRHETDSQAVKATKTSENIDTVDINIKSLINKTALFIIYKFINISILKCKTRQINQDLFYNDQIII